MDLRTDHVSTGSLSLHHMQFRSDHLITTPLNWTYSCKISNLNNMKRVQTESLSFGLFALSRKSVFFTHLEMQYCFQATQQITNLPRGKFYYCCKGCGFHPAQASYPNGVKANGDRHIVLNIFWCGKLKWLQTDTVHQVKQNRHAIPVRSQRRFPTCLCWWPDICTWLSLAVALITKNVKVESYNKDDLKICGLDTVQLSGVWDRM